MTKKSDSKITREVGERVDFFGTLDPTTVKSLGDGVFEAVVTTSQVDRTQENILTEGVDPKTWEQTGMPVLYGHDYSGLPIGKGLSWKSFKNKMTAKFQLAVEEYPFAATVASMIKSGYLNSVSIGGVVKQWSDDYRTIEQMEMVEFSVVPIPANPGALITSRSLKEATGKSVETIKGEYQDFSKKIMLDKLSELGEDEVIDAVKVLKLLTDRLEETAAKRKSLQGDKPTIKRYVLKDAKAVQTQSQKVIKIMLKEN